ncbi:MAG: hypothetical protein IJ520_06750, partial [Synergistaceae bacterium]|nr:hypothetical protein [Synergistaceae bacterium]
MSGKELEIKDIKRIKIDSAGNGIEEALNSVENLAENLELSAKDKFHMRLLAEEALGMVRAICASSEDADFNANFWTEWQSSILSWKSGGSFKIHIQADANVDYAQRRELIDVSSKKENIAPRGIME